MNITVCSTFQPYIIYIRIHYSHNKAKTFSTEWYLPIKHYIKASVVYI